MSTLQQQSFDQIDAINAPHLACVLLLDTSLSMAGSKIESLNNGINKFVEQTSADKLVRERVDIAVIEFNTHARVVQEFAPIYQIPEIKLEANGLTAMGEGIDLALDKVIDRNHLYDSLGTPCFKPWIFMITDGAPTDDISNAQARIAEREGKGKLKFWALGVPGYDEDTLKLISPKRVLALDNTDFTGIFNWLSQSMSIISVSRPGQAASIPAPPTDIIMADW